MDEETFQQKDTTANDLKEPPVESQAATKRMVAQQKPKAATTELYHDHSHITDDDKGLNELLNKTDQEGVKGTDQSFPVKLHQLLSGSDEDGFSHIVSWQPHGRSFIVKKHTEFVEKVLPCCFRQTKFASFQRQLNLYGFRRITQGRDKGGYYHELFLRGRSLLALKMQRTKVKGTGARKASSPETEPDFYSMPFVHEKKARKPNPVLVASPVATLPPASAVMSPASVSQGVPCPKLAVTQVSPSPAFSTKAIPDSLANSAILGLSPATGIASTNQLSGRHAPASLLGRAALNMQAQREANEARRSIMAQMIATSGRLLSLRESNRVSMLGSSAGNTYLPPSTGTRDGLYLGSSAAAASQQRGPLHLNSLNMPCTCAIPAF